MALKLSFTLPNYEMAVIKLADSARDNLYNSDELMSLFPLRSVVHLGSTMMCGDPKFLEKNYRIHNYTHSTELAIFRETNAVRFKEFLLVLVSKQLESFRQDAIELLDQTANITGNRVDAVNQNVWDAYIEAIEKVEMLFDDDGVPSFVIYPPEFKEKLAQTNPTVEQFTMIEQIFKRRFEDFQSKKKSRRLSI